MMMAMLFMLRRYAFGIMPFPNLYVTWFEHRRPATMTSICKGTMEKIVVYHCSRTRFSYSMYGFLHPGRIERA